MRAAAKLTGLTALAGGSFLVGTQVSNDWSPLNRLQSATAVAPAPMPPMPTAVPVGGKEIIGPSRASQIMVHGFPGFDNLRTFEDFVLSYDRRTKTAHWVCEHLTPDRLEYDPSVDRAKCAFRSDESMHAYFRSDNTDYKGSGYDRGHLAAAGNHRRTQNAVDQTFLLSNMSPQVGKGFNRDKWNDLEKHVRKQTKKCVNLYVITGPLYLAKKEGDGNLYVKYKVIGKNQVAVPTHFFKSLLIERRPGEFEVENYLMPNEVIPDSVPISSFLVPQEMIERSGGFLLFEKLDKKKLKLVNGKAGGWW
ncbi:hypothetical protein PENTCL1PPCAC_26865 [Pristionchus entomophagus]|uniref:Endonuclease n=1 Tax=Pristionchus entomophagus TaxID=358040 RepID=A0AAV5UCJ5_9BILA|nr:hypothetical protein PENTCL1PPCAC_26865 [Pristionchus entomophagus]